MSSGYWDTLKKHKMREQAKGHGFGYVIVNAPGIEHPIASTILATGGSGKERNLIFQPKAGIAGKKLPTKKTGLNSEGIRVMTPTEWGRLQLEPRNINNLVIQLQFLLLKKWPFLCCHVLKK